MMIKTTQATPRSEISCTIIPNTLILVRNKTLLGKASNLHKKKKLDLRGASRPLGINVRRPLTQVEKTPEPLPHPYTGAP